MFPTVLCRVALPAALIFVVAAAAPHVRGATASGDPVIAAAGDIACDPASPSYRNGNGTATSCHQKDTSKLVVKGRYTAVLPLGDNQYYCGSLTAYRRSFARTWGRTKKIMHPITGNHEYLTTSRHGSAATRCNSANANASGYFRYFGAAAGKPGKGYYSYNIRGGWHLIALNSQCVHAGGCRPGTPQYAWLRRDLAANRGKCVLAYWHIPLFSSGGLVSSAVRSFWQLLYAARADVILNGHDHVYERFAPQNPYGRVNTARGIREFVVGTGGDNHGHFSSMAANTEVRNNTTFGILELTLHRGSYDWRFVPDPRNGSFTDSGSATCHASRGSGNDQTLVVRKVGGGAGRITSHPAGINCTATCAHAFLRGSLVTLTARAGRRSGFVRWSGDCTGRGRCRLKMTTNHSVSARFKARCVVPKLKGKRLRAAKRMISRANCKMGKIRRVYSAMVSKGRVLLQRPRHHTRHRVGTRVNLVVSRGPRP